MSKWKRYVWTAGIFAVCLLFCGCGMRGNVEAQTAEGAETETDRVELQFYIWDDEESYIRKVVDSFNTVYPGIYVNLHVIKNEVYDDTIGSVIESGEKVDLIGIRGVTKICSYQQSGYLLELTDYLKQSDLDMTSYGNMVYSYTIDDRYYGLPTRNTYWVLFYNKTLFQEAGIAYPEQMTWEEYAQTALELTNDETGESKVWGGFFINWIYHFAGVQRQNYLYDDDISETLEGVGLLNRFYNEDQSHMPLEDVIALGDDWLDVFLSGQVAMMPQGEWTVNMLLSREEKQRVSVDWDIAPMPVFEGQDDYTTFGQYQFAGITQGCEYPEEAFQFLTYLCGEEGAKLYAGSGIISGYLNEEIQEIYRESVPGKNTDVFFESQRVLEQPAVPEYNELTSVLEEVSEKYLLGESTYEEAVRELEERREKIYG